MASQLLQRTELENADHKKMREFIGTLASSFIMNLMASGATRFIFAP